MPDIVRPPFPELVDNTMRSDFIFCKQKFKRAFIDSIAGMTPSVHLHAGGAFAAGLEGIRKSYFDEELPIPEAKRRGLEAIIKHYGDFNAAPTKQGDKSLDNVVRAYDSYFERYPIDRDFIKPLKAASGKHMIEFTFAIPMEVKHPVTGNPMLYGGRSDMIGIYNDRLFVTDEKTATSLGEQWANQWTLDSQMTGYIKAALQYGYPVVGAVIRGVGLLKTKISHAEAIIYRGEWQIERWWYQLHRDVKAMITAWEEGFFDFALSKSQCGAFGGCAYEKLCDTPHPEQYVQLYFRKRVWDPLAKDKGENLLEQKALFQDQFAPELNIPELK